MCLLIKIPTIILIVCSVKVFANNLENITSNFYSGDDSQQIDNSFVVSIDQQNLLKTHSFVFHFPKYARFILVVRSTRFYGNNMSKESTCYPVKMGVYRTKHENQDFIYENPFIQYRFDRSVKKTDFTLIPLTITSVFKMNYLHKDNCIRIPAVADFFGIVADDKQDNTCSNGQNKIHVFFENKNHSLCVYQLDEPLHRLLTSLDGIVIEESMITTTPASQLLSSTSVNNPANDKYFIIAVVFIILSIILIIIILYLLYGRRMCESCHVTLPMSEDSGGQVPFIQVFQMDNSVKTDSSLYYPINQDSEHRGYCLIINIQHFPNNPMNMNNRHESDIDRDRLKSTFERLGYKVLIHKNLTLEQIHLEIRKLARNVKSDHDSVVVCLLCLKGDQNFIYTTDGQRYHYRNSIMEDLGPRNCPALTMKPKIVIVQTGRVVMDDTNVNSPLQRDFLFSTGRNSFIETLCNCINDRFHKDGDILGTFARVNAQSDDSHVICEPTNGLTKIFRLGLNDQ